MTSDPLLDHLEKTFADAYRKEIDQEENVWRSLPFFAATLALQLAALAQVREWAGGIATGPAFWAALVLLAVAAVATLAALVSLALSVRPADYRRVAREPAFRDYAERVREAEALARPGASPEAVAEAALRAVKAALVEQYALAVDNNRAVNERRAKWRTRAGLATLVSVFAVLVLVALAVVSTMHGRGQGRAAADGRGRTGGGAGRHAAVPWSTALGEPGPSAVEQRPAPADGRGAQGLVERPRDGAASAGTGAGGP